MQQKTATDSRAVQLLLACARTRLDDRAAERSRMLLGDGIDWDALLTAAEAHGVTPLLHASLAKLRYAHVPADVQRRLLAAVRANVERNLFLLAELRRIGKRLEEAQVPASPFKGPALAAAVYGDVTLRQYSDLDIFVPRELLPRAAAVVMANGYVTDSWQDEASLETAVATDGRLAHRFANHYTFFRPDGRSRIDLQWRMADANFSFSLDRAHSWWRPLEPLNLGGLSLRSFEPTDMLLVLCVHGSKHRWEKLKWLCDIAESVRAHVARLDWTRLLHLAATLRVKRMLGIGLLLAEDLLDAKIPTEVSRELRTDAGLARIVRELGRDLREATPPALPHRRLEKLMFYLSIKDGPRDQIGFCASYASLRLGRVLRPTAADQRFFPLPARLSFLHYATRPVRLLAKYSRAAATAWRRKEEKKVVESI